MRKSQLNLSTRAGAAHGSLANVPATLIHDLRRSSIRDLIAAGASQSDAMSISGHETIATFLRYAIQNQDAKRKALRATETYLESQTSKRNVGGFGALARERWTEK